MPAKILDGRVLAAEIRAKIKTRVASLAHTPGLAAILVGDDPASHLYVSLKQKACEEAGIHFELHQFSDDNSETEVIARIRELNKRADIHAILVQIPLPPKFSEDAVIEAIDPQKDVDGFHPVNLDRILSGHPFIVPGVALGILRLVESARLPLADKTAVLLVNSAVFALPIERLFEEKGLHVHVVLAPKNLTTLDAKFLRADVLITAIGRPQVITSKFVKENAIVIDVGTNRLPDGTLVGDVDFSEIQKMAAAITPVPGGVGPMTVAMLLENVVRLAELPSR
ncbi:MAG: tetrahydrofolate dehydrogenase/cyclohydrolase catalytic domain-containing protein [bacterium]|nr:tetrahydrofolate dehydrogenase/cyclohydrolase catalytic domain-containing protein [bacterium]